MRRYPLTYAVFFQSIIKPFSSLTQYKANHALFFGELFDIEPSNDAIAAGTYSDYVKGLRPVRATLINDIYPMSLINLSKRITMLGLQDMPAVLETTKKLLSIMDISEQLRTALLDDAQSLTAEQFLAKIFQYSLMCSNTKIKLTKKDIHYLNNFGLNESDNPENTFFDINDEIVHIIEEASKSPIAIGSFLGNYIYEQDLTFPEDFNSFIAYIAPFVDSKGFINLDFADVQSVCSFDLENKTCKDGTIKIFEIQFLIGELSILDKVLEKIHTCENCMTNIIACTEFGIEGLSDVILRVSDNLAPNANFLFGMNYSNDMISKVKIQMICKFDNTLRKEPDIPKQADTSHDSTQKKEDWKKHMQKELKIPSFLQK